MPEHPPPQQAEQESTYRLSDGTVRPLAIEAPQPDAAQVGRARRVRRKTLRDFLEWGLVFALVLTAFFLGRAYWAEPIRVDGQSMTDTLAHNEYVWVAKRAYASQGPQRMDVVLCRYPDAPEPFIKRVVGLPGETIALRSGELYVNDVQVPMPWITHNSETITYGPVTVPQGHYVVMGDNRLNSRDSRALSVGPISQGHILGQAQYVVFPFDKIRPIGP